ncbi:MAG: FAD-dependent oxidoreductase [Candidatus Omnitrophica bacterium]|nr:FAD-dependent oxidoreductase [Candidatus Omnitrophota bacterium]
MYDLVIIGAGPAGITASVYAARKRMNFLVISEDIGGQTAWSGDIENYTGYQFIAGTSLVAKFAEHMKKYEVPLKEGEKVKRLTKESNSIKIKTESGEYETKTVIIASGKKSRELGIPGEKQFKNKGVTYCATCDGPVFAGKDVAVIGGGNAGLEAVIQLMKIAKKIYLIEASNKITGDAILEEKARYDKKVEIVTGAEILEITGDKMVNGLKIKVRGAERKIPLEGIFVEIGLVPNSAFLRSLEKNKKGEIKINSYNETSISGIFAAGDVTDIPEKQIIIAAGEGAKATLSVFRYLARSKGGA